MGRPAIGALLGIVFVSTAMPPPVARAEEIVFRSAVDGSPLDLTPKAGEVETDAVRKFKRSGRNPYIGQQRAVREGRRLYQARCQACHLKDGTGRLGPSLITDQPEYAQSATDVGMFEIIYGGATGSMQPFSLQGLRQDNILKVMAYVTRLRRPLAHTDEPQAVPSGPK
jgi:cytochrome c-L